MSWKTETEIIELLDEYQAARTALDAIIDQKPKPKPKPVPCTIEQYEQIEHENESAQSEYDRRRTQALVRYNEADTALFRAIPNNVWIALPSRKISIGFETGTWGGHTHSLHIAKDGEQLNELPHVTYYP